MAEAHLMMQMQLVVISGLESWAEEVDSCFISSPCFTSGIFYCSRC